MPEARRFVGCKNAALFETDTVLLERRYEIQNSVVVRVWRVGIATRCFSAHTWQNGSLPSASSTVTKGNFYPKHYIFSLDLRTQRTDGTTHNTTPTGEYLHPRNQNGDGTKQLYLT
jgi:hypothetical protein